MACFAQLRDNIPTWISDVNQLSTHVHNKRAEFAADAAKEAASISSPPRRRKSVSSSLASNRTQNSHLQPPTTSASNRLKRFLSRESLRLDGSKKRRAASPEPTTEEPPATAGSEVVSPGKKKPKHLISYDGHTQKVLEKMVRDIWTAKSSIRSSRIQSSMRSAFGDRMRMQIPTQKRSSENMMPTCAATKDNKVEKAEKKAEIEIDDSAEEIDIEDPMQLRMLVMKERQRRYLQSPTRVPGPPPASSSQQLQSTLAAGEAESGRQQPAQTRPKQCPYDFIEGQLDNAQNMCENAAYRFLRHGNCLEELESILRAYEFILEASTSMAEKEEKEQAEAAAATATTTKKEAEKETGDVPSDNDNISIEVDDLEVDDDNDNEETVDAAAATFVPATLKSNKDSDFEDSNGGILEVDDRSDTSEVSIDITAFRMTRYGQRTMHPFTVNRVR